MGGKGSEKIVPIHTMTSKAAGSFPLAFDCLGKDTSLGDHPRDVHQAKAETSEKALADDEAPESCCKGGGEPPASSDDRPTQGHSFRSVPEVQVLGVRSIRARE